MSEIIYADKNVALTFYVPLTTFSGATLQGLEDGPTIQVNPTLASGDAKHSGDGGAFANLGTLPVVTPASGRAVKIVLSQAEMNYDCVFIQLVDQTNPKEWADKAYTILTKPLAVSVASVSGAVGSVTGNVGGNVVGSVGSVTGAVGSVTGLTASNLDATISSRASAADLATVAGYLDTEIAAIKAKTDNLPSDPADASVIAGRFDTLDTSIADLPTNAELTTALGTADDAVLTAIDALPTANENADALLDRSAGVETNRTPRQALRLMLAALAGKASGLATTTAIYRDTNDSVDRITATVDADGNRSAVTLDAS